MTPLPVSRLSAIRSMALCYHGLGESSPAADPAFLMVRPDRFRRQLELLLEAGFRFVTVAELVASLPGDGGPPPPGMVSLSFDDGTQDNHTVLLPILQEYEVTATIYVATGFIGRPNPWLDPATAVRFMTEDELREVASAGVEIGAHTVTHPDLAQLSHDDCLREMRESRATLERIVDRPVTTFAYPFCSYSQAALAAVREAGFDAAVTCHARGGWTPFELRRTMITGKDGMPTFVLKIAGVYEPLFHSAPVRAARAATRGPRAVIRSARGRA
jgi:peptidoglycan/xylan/chitin deacetylase (PgdA/CDA1 family)